MEKTIQTLSHEEVNANVMKQKSSILEWGKFIVFLIFIFFIIHNTIGFITVSGSSMVPTLEEGNIIFEEKVSKYLRNPGLGDIVIISRPAQGYKIVKRVIGTPNDKVKIENGIIYINEEALPEISTLGTSDDMEEVTIPANHVFVMGDHRTPGESIDSRDQAVGPISIDEIDGYAIVSLLPFRLLPKPLELD
ncbi:signal peptidase I [Bacillus sp. FJAT-27445]|uniref:signal peptidase I n=1 Tax=Bacillus sp. FJAT-27445 TaxID=1679166 RepID=UPI0007443563|nr:signal peptidase I [Bacillus sp. FJAT-27445]